MYVTKTTGSNSDEITYTFVKERNFNNSYGKKRIGNTTINAAIEKITNKISYRGISFKPALQPQPIPRNKQLFELFGGFAIDYDPNFVFDCSKFRRLLWHIKNI